MPAFHVISTIDIAASPASVHKAITDFNTWPIWSPWLLMERACTIRYQGTPGELEHGYEWSGDRVGAGKMSLKSIDSNKVEAELTFLKPWKSYADITFNIEPLSTDSTRVSWLMNSKLPFFMYFSMHKLKAMIATDYTRGLKMLRDYLEKGKVRSNSIVEGLVDVPLTLYAGKSHQSSIDDISHSMRLAFPEVVKAVGQSSTDISGKAFSIYNHMNVIKGSCSYTAAVPIARRVRLSDGVACSERAACRALRVVHTGAYRYLENAWATGHSELQNSKLKRHNTISPFEVYLNDPDEVREEFLITELYFPLRS